MGMDIEVVGRTWYTVHLTDEDVEKIKKYIKDHDDDLPSFDQKKNILWAIERLGSEIEFYSDDKYVESDFAQKK